MRIEVLENVKLMYQNETKQIWMVYHPLEQHYFIKKVLYGHFNERVYEILKMYPHKGFAKVYAVVKEETMLVVIEEFVNGCTLEYEMSEHILPRSLAIQYIFELFDVLQHLHALTPPIIHRDIKPANVMHYDQHMMLIDFDIAREFERGQSKDTRVMGSIGYAAPEQYGFLQSDPRTDIYAMGILINEMLVNRHPQEEMAVGKIAEVIKRCTHLDPEQRYLNISELRIAFSKAMAVPIDRTIYKTKKMKRKELLFYIATCLLAILFFTTIKDVYTYPDKINQTLILLAPFYFAF